MNQRDEQSPALGSITHQPSSAVDRLNAAKELILALRPTIHQNYVTTIQGRNYIMVAGAQALASAMGYTVRIQSCEHRTATDIPGHWEAVAIVVDSSSGMEIGSGYGHVFDDERPWGAREKFAQAAMCQTRATGRALKSCVGWMFALCGAEGSFLEEMPQTEQPRAEPKAATQVAPSKAYRPPAKTAAETKGAILEETIVVESVQVVNGTTGAGKPYTRWIMDWLTDGVACKGATFSAIAGEVCIQAQKTRDQVYIEYVLGQYGKDIRTASVVDPMSRAERTARDETIQL